MVGARSSPSSIAKARAVVSLTQPWRAALQVPAQAGADQAGGAGIRRRREGRVEDAVQGVLQRELGGQRADEALARDELGRGVAGEPELVEVVIELVGERAHARGEERALPLVGELRGA